jgi:SSS family solute:Na+ symporter
VVLYPHTITGVLELGERTGDPRKRRAAAGLQPLLALIALLGFMALAAGIHTANTSSVVPLLFVKMFPDWFAGFCLAAIGIGALVPAAIMSIASANLFTRNLLRRGAAPQDDEQPKRRATPSWFRSSSSLARWLLCSFVKSQYAIELQLLGGIWIGQLFPAVICGVFTRWFYGKALFWGWAAGMATGTGDGHLSRLEELDLSVCISRGMFMRCTRRFPRWRRTCWFRRC